MQAPRDGERSWEHVEEEPNTLPVVGYGGWCDWWTRIPAFTGRRAVTTTFAGRLGRFVA